MSIKLGLNLGLRDNNVFFDPDAPLHLSLSEPMGYASRLTSSIMRGLKGGTILDIESVVDIPLGKLKDIKLPNEGEGAQDEKPVDIQDDVPVDKLEDVPNQSESQELNVTQNDIPEEIKETNETPVEEVKPVEETKVTEETPAPVEEVKVADEVPVEQTQATVDAFEDLNLDDIKLDETPVVKEPKKKTAKAE